MRKKHRCAKFSAELEHPTDVIAVLMSDHDCIHIAGLQTDPIKPGHCLFDSETTVHHQARGGISQRAFKQPTVTLTATAQARKSHNSYRNFPASLFAASSDIAALTAAPRSEVNLTEVDLSFWGATTTWKR